MQLGPSEPELGVLPPPAPDEIRRVSRYFSCGTASAADGLHCRHFSLASDEGLECVGLLLWLMEA
eukprot:5970516-Lingulodinium_polyedra.AAC.1